MAESVEIKRVKIDPRRLKNVTKDQLIKNMAIATVFLRDRVKLKLNRGQPTRTTAGGYIIGLDPSKPGEPPKKVTSQYLLSMRQKVVTLPTEVVGLVGTDQKRGPALEFGNRKGTLLPRPHFRPSISENRRTLLNIVAKGFGGF